MRSLRVHFPAVDRTDTGLRSPRKPLCHETEYSPPMIRPRRLLPVAVLAIVACLAMAPAAGAKSRITMSGSTSIYPLAKKLAQSFVKQKKYKGKVSINLLEGGSDTGIIDVSRGRVSIGNSSRDPKAADPKGIVFNKIARDAVCVVTHPDNKLASLSQKQIQDIFTGRVRTWSRVPGATASGPIQLLTRTAASGTQDAFQNIFLGQSLRVSGNTTPYSKSGLQAEAIRNNEQGIGYVSFNFTKGTNVPLYRGSRCSLRNAKSGSYQGVRNFYMVTRGKAKGATKSFIRFIRNSKPAKKIVATNWVPLR